MTGTRWERIGAWSGVAFVILTFATFFTPATPDADAPSAEIVREIAADRTGHIASFYVSGIAWILFLAFVAGLWALLRRAEPAPGAAALALAGGIAVYAGVLVEQSVFLAVVSAADAGREPAAVRALYEVEEVVLVPLRFAAAAFFAGIALAAIPPRSLPGWLGWSAAALAAVLVIGLLGTFSADPEDGPLVPILVLGRLGILVWILAAGIAILRRRSPAEAGERAATAPSGARA